MMGAEARSTSVPLTSSQIETEEARMAGSNKHVTKLWKRKKHKDELGCVQKHVAPFESAQYPRCSYRKKCYTELKDHPTRRKLYELDLQDNAVRERLQTVSMPEEYKIGANRKMTERYRTPVNPLEPGNEKVWGFDHSNNFKENAFEPFNHNYHHIMPDEVLTKELKYEELAVLQAAEYNINKGNNLIILPCSPAIGVALALPTHPGRHGSRTNYAQDCINEINEIKQEVSMDENANPPHPITDETAPAVREDLEAWQNDEFDDIVAYGREGGALKMAVMINNKLRNRNPG
jgi:hypothetical protein